MPERPRILCLMSSSLDGRLHLSRWTTSPDGTTKDWSGAYEQIHEGAKAQGWIVGRTTMAEMSKGLPHPPARFDPPPRPYHFATRQGPFAFGLDRSGKVHFTRADIGGDHAVMLLGAGVDEAHLAELIVDGVSYIVAEDDEMALAPLLATLRRELGIETLMLEGGGDVNGSFLSQGFVDELFVILTPTLDGSPSPAIVEAGDDGLKGKVELSLQSCDQLDNGAVRLRYSVTALGNP